MRPTSKRHILTEQINAYETQLQRLMEDYKSSQGQLGLEVNPVTKNAIRRQILELEKEIEETQKKHDEFVAKIQQLDSKIYAPRHQNEYLQPKPRSEVPSLSPSLPVPGITIRLGWFSRYLPFIAFTLITLLLWYILAVHGISLHSEIRNPDEYKNRLTLYGLLGGTTNGILLFLTTKLRNSSQKLLAGTNLIRAIIYCGSGALLGSVAWYITESNVQRQGNPANYGNGAEHGAIICTMISIAFSIYCFYIQSKERGKRKLNR